MSQGSGYELAVGGERNGSALHVEPSDIARQRMETEILRQTPRFNGFLPLQNATLGKQHEGFVRFETFELDFRQPIQARVSRRDQFDGMGRTAAPCAKCSSAEPAWQVVDDPKRGLRALVEFEPDHRPHGVRIIDARRDQAKADGDPAELVVRNCLCVRDRPCICDCLCVLYGVAQSRQPDHPSGVAGPEEMSVLGRKK